MDKIQILNIPEVVFRPKNPITPPDILNNNVSFPCVPSCRYYYVSYNGDKVPIINNVGTSEEQKLSLAIWYNMPSDEVFHLLTQYAKGREDQIDRGMDRPPSNIAFSMKRYEKQYPDSSDWFFEDRFQLLIGQAKIQSIDKFVNDFYRYPLNPSADAFMVARLMETYISSGDETELRKYLRDRGIYHLVNHSFGYYPVYELFFLLTRFASYPMTEAQLRLAERRSRTTFGSPERVFIDAIFQYEVYNITQVLQIIEQIASQGPMSVSNIFKTNNINWIRWADEYLKNLGTQAVGIENISNLNYIVAGKLYTWNDLQIEQLCNRLKITMPFTSQFPTRYSFVQDIAGRIIRFRSDPSEAALWKRQVVEGFN